ncbi:hypothetical protein HAX54_034868 [Datura stramonium]|uniref:Importin-5-like n=1 Tax=Datura stramonium TaxID=4076 RepID=A0ABS8SEM8_DATST|nr:hypothetical protein [Datura stramonium]
MDTKLIQVQMEAILGPDSEPFETFVSDPTWSSEEKDSEAMSMFNMMKQKDSNTLAIKLVNYLGSSHDIYSCRKCADLLSQLLNDEDLCTWRNLSVSTQSTVKSILLKHMKLEETESITLTLGYTVNNLVPSLITDNNWPELLPFLYQCLTSTSNNYMLKVTAFLIFAKLAEDIGETIVSSLKNLHSLFRNALNDDTLDLDVRIAAMWAVISFYQCVSSSNEKEQFQYLLPGMMKTMTDALRNDEEEVTWRDQFPLKYLIKLAKDEPRFFRRQLADVVATMFEIAEDEYLKEKTRHLAVVFLITLAEAKKRAPGMMKRLPLFFNRCLAMSLKLLLDIKDDPDWHSAETVYDYSGILSNHIIGEEGLRRFCIALRGKFASHMAIEQLCDHLTAAEWEKRHAALIALPKIAEGCSKVMIKNLEQVLNMVINCFQDPHPRVRWAACRAIDQFSSDLSPHLQEQYHNQVFLALAAAMDDFHPRVQACALRALTNFCVHSKPETSISYLDGMVNKLLVLLQNDKHMVQQEALSALASIAGSAEEHFRAYYDNVMPHLKTVLRNADLKSDLILLSHAIECISIVGEAVGKEIFRDDEKQMALQSSNLVIDCSSLGHYSFNNYVQQTDDRDIFLTLVMEVLISLQGSLGKDDNLSSCDWLITACSRICKCIRQDFIPYMSTVMPFLIQCAQLEPVMTNPTEYWHYENYEDGNRNPENFVEEEARACYLLCSYADILKEDFYPWISQAVSIFVPLLKLHTHNRIRISAVNAMSILLCSAKLAAEKRIVQSESESHFTKLSDYIILSLVEALNKEHVTKICAIMLDELNDCLQICGPLLNEGQVRSIVDEIKHVITDSSSRKQELTERAKLEDFDAEEAELLREESEQEEGIFDNVGEILCTLIKAFKAAFLPFLDELSSYLLPMWAKEKTPNERCTSICIFDALVEEFPEAALKYYDICLPLILDASNDEDPNVRQAALCGLRLWMEYGGSSFKPFVGEAVSRIIVVIMHFNALEPENLWAYDNAVSALGKICQNHGESIDSAKVIPVWLNCLPIKADLDEAKDVHEQLCSMVERSDRELLGPNYQHLPKVVSVFAEVLYSVGDLATDETACRMIKEMELRSILSPGKDADF